MKKASAGVLLYRKLADGIEVLLVHPGGPFWARKDAEAWSIPKGEVAEGEDLLRAAMRELKEETGWSPPGIPLQLEPIQQRGGKVVHAWALAAEVDPETLRSNTFTLEWPPKSGRHQDFPEVDRAAWFSLEHARRKILPSQAGLLDQLEKLR